MDSDYSSGQHCLTFVELEAPVLWLNEPNISFGVYDRTDSAVTGNILHRKTTSGGIRHEEYPQVQHQRPIFL